MNQSINIEEHSTLYDIKLSYHSDLMCENYDAKIRGIVENDGRITLNPDLSKPLYKLYDDGFVFNHSDPDRVIAIAQMMLAFAQMAKNEQKNTVDTNANS